MNKLTEREKWLMQQAWNVSKDYDQDMDYWLTEETGCNGVDVEMLIVSEAPGEQNENE